MREHARRQLGLSDALRPDRFTAGVLAAAALYVALAWSPSSYGIVLERLGAGGAGLVAGTPREVRADEWAIWTPYLQAAVHNGFQRFNSTSVYGEDLRNYNGLPLADWGLALKPYFWPFFLVDAAHAFAFMHAFFIAAFLLGYRALFVRLGLDGAEAALASVLLFFTAFVQAWWTTLGPVLAGFPWLVVLAAAPVRPPIKVAGLAYATAAWLLAHLYPPLMITLAFAAAVALLASRRDALRPGNVAACAVGVGIGAALAFLYLREPIAVMAATVFPGERVSAGGGEPGLQWWSQLWPNLVSSGHRHLVNVHFCAAATVGTYLPLLALVFLDHRACWQRWRRGGPEVRRLAVEIAVLAVGVLLCSLWMLAPIAPAVGRVLLWDQVPPERMWFACGFLLLLLSLRLLREPSRLSAARLAAAVALVVGGWIASEHWIGGASLAEDPAEAAILLPLVGAVAFRERLGVAPAAALIGAAAFANLVGFGLFNPIQSARPIFDLPRTALSRQLDGLAERHPRGWLVVGGTRTWGAVLNGWGYAAPMHLLVAPRLDFFRERFPELSEAEIDHLFNGFLHVKLTAETVPSAIGRDAVQVPIEAFDPPTTPVRVAMRPPGRFPPGGAADYQEIHAGPTPYALLVGWSEFDATDPGSGLTVTTNLPVDRAVAFPTLRPALAARSGRPSRMTSGFSLRLDLAADWRRVGAPVLCVVASDPRGGAFLVRTRGDCSAMRAPPAGLTPPAPPG